MAASSDTIENTQKIASEWDLNFPVAHGLDPAKVSDQLGAFYEPDRNIVHTTNYVIRPDGKIAVAGLQHQRHRPADLAGRHGAHPIHEEDEAK